MAFWVRDFANKVAVFTRRPDTDVHARASLALRLNGSRDTLTMLIALIDPCSPS